MGLMRRLMLGKPTEGGIRAEATVTSRSNIPTKKPAYMGGSNLGLLIKEGDRDRAAEYKGTAPRKLFPEVGQTIPVLIDPNDPEKVQVVWDELPVVEGQ